jgi:hypothetical protein
MHEIRLRFRVWKVKGIPVGVHGRTCRYATSADANGPQWDDMRRDAFCGVETTMIYTHVIRTLTNKAESPLDAI